MKMKLPDLSGKVIVIRSDQEEARKCYENSLKTKRGVFMVYERPPCVDMTMIEATPAWSTPIEAIPARATPEADAPMEEGPSDAAPVQEAAPVEDDSREQPEDIQVREFAEPGRTGRGGRSDFAPPGCLRMVHLEYARYRP